MSTTDTTSHLMTPSVNQQSTANGLMQSLPVKMDFLQAISATLALGDAVIIGIDNNSDVQTSQLAWSLTQRGL